MWFISSPNLKHGYMNLLAASVYTEQKALLLKANLGQHFLCVTVLPLKSLQLMKSTVHKKKVCNYLKYLDSNVNLNHLGKNCRTLK